MNVVEDSEEEQQSAGPGRVSHMVAARARSCDAPRLG